MEKTRKWRWGKYRWYVLGFIILSIIQVVLYKNFDLKIFRPVQPLIQVAPESIMHEPLFTLPVIGDFYITNTMVAMLMVDIVIILIALAVKNGIKKNGLVPKGITGAMEMLVELIHNLTETTAGKWTAKLFPWFATIMILVLFTNLIKLLPGYESIGILEHAEEGGYAIQPLGSTWSAIINEKVTEGGYELIPFARALSTDLNFTLALALISVIMTQIVGIQAHGIGYFSKFLNFKTMFKKPLLGFMDFLVGLLEVISEFSKILSFTFRLFGNMFAGMVLLALISTMLPPVFLPSMIMVFELFIGVIQAFVFGMLTLVFMAQATQGHGEEEQHA